MEKYYLVNIITNLKTELRNMFDGKKEIRFEMPSFCSGDYTAKIYKDELGLYIDAKDNYFRGCRDYEAV